jgi:hypothetical protein
MLDHQTQLVTNYSLDQFHRSERAADNHNQHFYQTNVSKRSARRFDPVQLRGCRVGGRGTWILEREKVSTAIRVPPLSISRVNKLLRRDAATPMEGRQGKWI